VKRQMTRTRSRLHRNPWGMVRLQQAPSRVKPAD
jgi:hypothetical protein